MLEKVISFLPLRNVGHSAMPTHDLELREVISHVVTAKEDIQRPHLNKSGM